VRPAGRTKKGGHLDRPKIFNIFMETLKHKILNLVVNAKMLFNRYAHSAWLR